MKCPASYFARWLVALALAAGLAACTDRSPSVSGINAAAGGGSGDLTVTSTDPNNAPQDTTLDVLVSGSGFDKGSQAQWAIAGVPTAKIRTNSTRFVSPKQLVANITIALDADTVLYDVVVTTTTGKKGIGTELFKVNQKGVAVGQVLPDPRIAFYAGGAIQVMNADGNKLFTVADASWTGWNSPTAWGPGGNGTPTNPYHLLFTADATYGQWRLAVVDVDTTGGIVTGRNHRIIPTSEWAVHFAWSPLGDSIVVADGAPQVYPAELHLIAPDGGGEHTVYAAPDSDYIRYPAWSADARYTFFVAQPGGSSSSRYVTRGDAIRVLDLATRGVTLVIQLPANTVVRGLDVARRRTAMAYATGPFSCGRPPKNCFDQVFVQELDAEFQPLGSATLIGKGRHPSWAPNDAALIFSDGTVHKYEFATGRTTNLTSGDFPDWRR